MAKIRTTLTIDEDVLARYQAIAQIQDESLSSVVSSWLKHTVEGAELLGLQINKIKSSLIPAQAASEMAATLEVLQERYAGTIFRVNGEVWRDGGALRQRGGSGPQDRPIPPSSNTGGKGTKPRTTPPSSRAR